MRRPCDDGNVCTVDDICFQGDCQGGGPKNCGDGNACTTDTCAPSTDCVHVPVNVPCCNTNEDCADTDACTVNERCVNNACVSDPRDCSDDNVCTIDSCNNSGGGFVCQHPDCHDVIDATCAPTCVRAECGNGVVEPGETCDPPDR
jgi:hypothetical protein